MFKRKNLTESDEPAEKRSRLSDEGVNEGLYNLHYSLSFSNIL